LSPAQVVGEHQDFNAVVGADTERRSQLRDEFSDELALEIPPSVKTVVNKCSRESAPAGRGTASVPGRSRKLLALLTLTGVANQPRGS
jgi:hypothetical protein